MRHLVCVACSSIIDFELCGTVKTWAEAKEADFECWCCRQVKQLKKDIDDLKEMLGAQKGNEVAKSVRTADKVTTTTSGNKKTGGKRLGGQFMGMEDLGLQKERNELEMNLLGEKTAVKGTVDKETEGKLTGRKEVKNKVPREKSTANFETTKITKKYQTKGKDSHETETGLTQRRSYSNAVKEGAIRTGRVFMGDSIIRKTDKILNQGEDIVVCLPGAKIEHVTERVGNVMGHGNGGSILVHVGTNNADREGTTGITQKYRELVRKLKQTRASQITISGILPIMGGRQQRYRNCKRMAINALVKQMCEKEKVEFIDLWGCYIGKEDMFMRDGLHLNGKGAAVLADELQKSVKSGTGGTHLN